MKSVITLGFPHGGGDSVLIHGTKVPVHVQRAKLKERLSRGSDPDFERVEIWSSSGAVKKRFRTPSDASARVAANLPTEPEEQEPDETGETVETGETKADETETQETKRRGRRNRGE